MSTKLKKSKSAGRFGARYGKKVRARVVGVEEKQKQKQKCPFCNRLGVKRVSKGIWSCPRCEKKFADNAFYLE